MPNMGFICLSLASLLVGALLFLYPRALLRLSTQLNRTLSVLDDQLIRRRYIVGLLAFAASYAFFQIALLLPALKG